MYQKHISFQKIINLVEGMSKNVPVNLFHHTKNYYLKLQFPCHEKIHPRLLPYQQSVSV
jgi:hypothetical protein